MSHIMRHDGLAQLIVTETAEGKRVRGRLKYIDQVVKDASINNTGK